MATGDKHYIGVKSIQRGTITITTNTGTSKSENVTINAIDPNKSILLIQYGNSSAASSNNYGSVIGEIVDETTLKFTTLVKTTTNWQVIEFY